MCIICTNQNLEQIGDVLNLYGCPKITELPKLPDNIQVLVCSNCKNLKYIPALPPFLRLLECSGCTQLTEIPTLPISLKQFACNGCVKLKEIPPLPLNLTLFSCAGTNIRFLPQLSDFLFTLDCTNCRYLVKLPDLPPLYRFSCSQCPWLSYKNPSFNTNIKKLIILQKNMKKICFSRRIIKRYYLKKFFCKDLVSLILSF